MRTRRPAQRAFGAARRASEPAAFTLLHMLVYGSALLVLTGVGFAAMYRCMDNSLALRRNAEDIANALRAGENWRADVRAAGGQVRVETAANEVLLRLPGPRFEVDYLFATNTLLRRIGDNPWTPVLGRVQAVEFAPAPHRTVTAWKWELELQPRAKKLGRIRPLFTFIAVPAGASTTPPSSGGNL